MRHRPPPFYSATKERKTDVAWLRAALAFGASMSKDPETKVGACVVSPDNMRASFGYNGFPIGVPDTEDNWANKELKNALVQHAELNALAKAPFSVDGATCYVTLKPCHLCLGALVNAGVDRVVWLDPRFDPPLTQPHTHWRLFNEEAFELIRSSSGILCLAYHVSQVERAMMDAIAADAGGVVEADENQRV